jgi:hypothetical protein
VRASVGPTIGLGVRAVLAFVWLVLFFRRRVVVLGAPVVLAAISVPAGDGISP